VTAENRDEAFAGDQAAAGADDAKGIGEEDQADVAEIRADIEETRLEMGSTLNELGDRLEPGHLIDQAKENVREATIGRVEETARGVSDVVLDTIKRNPIPAAMAGVGMAMLWKNRNQGRGSGHGSYGTDYGYPSRPGNMYAGERRDDLGSKVGDAASTVRQSVSDTASEVAQNIGGAAGGLAVSAQQAGGEVVSRAGETAQQVGWKLDSFMQANPLAMGAIAVGAGAVIGSVLPETEQEREMLGDASRQISSAVRDTVEDATTRVEETLDGAEQQVGSPG
jgi:ElaB/YqjD/DUF883 family membrane-anchored ribosome-binding protein